MATGAASGGAFGATLVATSYLGPAASWAGVIYGAALGAIAAVPISLLGAGAVLSAIRTFHPNPESEEAVRRTLTWIFAVVVGVLALPSLLLVLYNDIASGLLLLATSAFGAALVPLWARGPLARFWATAV